MNDPGHDESIANASSIVQESSHGKTTNTISSQADDHFAHLKSPAYSKQGANTQDAAHEMPTRWWYASTGFPLVAGTFGPMANAFSICALVENWRVSIPPGGTEEHGIDIPDPKWLIVLNVVSLVCALVANASLLLNMAKRVPFRWAQPVTIAGFWLSSVILTIMVGIAAHQFHAPNVQEQALTQAYYYACWAAGLYQLISLMMCVTVYGAMTGRYSSDFNLTMAQRTLMLQTIVFLGYLLIGAVIYSHIENWKFLDAVYWADFTLLTVGLGGDMVPTTHLGRGLLFPFSIGGIVALGLVVSSIRTMILDRGKRKLHARMTEKMRRKLVKQVEEITSATKIRRRRVTGLNKNMTQRLTLEPTDDPNDELDRRRAEFDAMRKVEQLTSKRQKWMNLVVSTTAFAMLWLLGALVFWQTEGRNQGWSYFVSLYFAWTSLLTIGYGDFVPDSNAGRPFFVFWSLLAVPSLTILISDMGDTVVEAVKDATIWIGEVTILPSNEGSITDRLRYGIAKTLRIQMSRSKPQDEEETSDNESQPEKSPFQQPGMVRLFKNRQRRSSKDTGRDQCELEAVEHFEAPEEPSEQRDQLSNIPDTEHEHHYRRQLIIAIRKLYGDTTLATPKQYSYEEWAFYLKLLGEDESSSVFHGHAPVKSHENHHSHQHSGDRTCPSESERSHDDTLQQGKISQWSWIGPRSPLMARGNQSESAWLILRLFEQLEQSLHPTHKSWKTGAAGSDLKRSS